MEYCNSWSLVRGYLGRLIESVKKFILSVFGQMFRNDVREGFF